MAATRDVNSARKGMFNAEFIKCMYTLFETLFLSNEMRQKQFFVVYDPEGTAIA